MRLVQKPVEQLQTLRHKPASVKRALSVGTQRLPGFVPDENVYELDASFSTDVSNTFGLNLCVGEGRKVVVSYDTDSHNLVIDRTHCSDVQIPKFSRMAYARVEPVDNKIRLHIFVDKSSIEIFANDGKDVFTLLTYPGEAQTGIELLRRRRGRRWSWMPGCLNQYGDEEFNLYYFRLNVTFVVCFETKKIASCCLVAYLCMVENIINLIPTET